MGEVAQLRDAIVVAILGVVRMDADRRIDIGVAFRDGDGLAVAFDRADRADRDYRAQAGGARAFQDRFGIAAQLGVGEMAVRIGQVQMGSFRHFLSGV